MADGQRRPEGRAGFGANLVSTLSGGVAEQIKKRQEQEDALKLVFAKALAEARIKQAFPSAEEQTQQQILGLTNRLQPTPTPTVPGFGSGYTEQERGLGLPAQVEEAARSRNAPVQSQIDTLMRTLGKKPQEDFLTQVLQAEEISAARARWRQGIVEPRQQFLDTSKVREEFLNRPEVKEYVSVNTSVRSMDEMLQRALEGGKENKVAIDQSLITMFNKLTDPNSVVRESEYARTPGNLPFTNRFTGAFQKLQRGGAGLTNDDRKALVLGAKVIADERGRTFNETRQGYVDLSQQYNFDPSIITRGQQPHQPFVARSGTTPSGFSREDALAELRRRRGR